MAGPAGPAGLVPVRWRLLAAAGLGLPLAALGFLLLPADLRAGVPVVVSLLAAGACLRTARRGAAVPRFWYPLSAGLALFTGSFLAAELHLPQPVQLGLLGLAYVLVAVSVWPVLPQTRAHGMSTWLDLPLVLGSAAVLEHVLFLQPALSGVAAHGGVGPALQPALALVLLPIAVRALVGGTSRLPSHALLLLAAVMSLLADLALTFQALRGHTAPGQAAVVLPVLSQLCVLAAALHPGAVHVGQRATQRPRGAAQTLWLAPVALAVVALPWVVEQAGLPRQPAVTATAAVGVVLSLVARAVLLVRRAERASTTDALTGLASRSAFETELAELVELRETVAVLYVDLDGFKAVNDAGGHSSGDALLRDVAQRMRGLLRRHDVAARVGGDEFAVLLRPGPDGLDAEQVANRLCDALRAPFLVHGRVMPVTASVGVVPPRPDEPAESLLSAADLAMYAAKTAGVGRVQVYDEDLRIRVRGSRERASELERAAAGDPAAGRLLVHYQPILDLADRTVHGAEALLRWQHPQEGLLAAGAFLHLVQSPDLARRLDELVLREALDQLAAWQQGGGPLSAVRLAVNLSTATLLRPDLAELVGGSLERAGAAAHGLALEITEHEAVPEAPSVERALLAVSGTGVEVWLDDFGVGYTALSYLERFPIAVLKVDKSLTAAALPDRSTPLLEGLQSLGRQVGVRTLAEGIETEEQAQHLRQMGFELGQGYQLGRPLAAGALEERVGVRAAAGV